MNKATLILIVTVISFLTGCLAPPGGDGGAGSGIAALIPFVLIFVLFYFLILRPQRKQSKERDEMLEKLKRGDRVVTSGGIHGRIINVHDDTLTVEIAKGVNVRMSRDGVSGLVKKKDKDKEENSEK